MRVDCIFIRRYKVGFLHPIIPKCAQKTKCYILLHSHQHSNHLFYSTDEEWNTEPTEDSLFLVQNNSWPSKELSLPRARRHNSSGFDSSPVTSPGSANTSPDDHRFIHEPSLQQYCNKKPVRSIPSSDFERKQPLTKCAEDLRTTAPRNTFFDKVASKSEMKLDTSPSSPPKKRNPEDRQRSPSPNEIASPRERFKDAKEKFLLLERERLEAQDKLLQQNLEKRKSLDYATSQQQLPVAKPRASKSSWKRDSGEELDARPRHYRQHGADDLADNYQQPVENHRRSTPSSRLSYHRNKSMESLNSEEYPSIASGSHKNGSVDHTSSNGISSQTRSKQYADDESRYHSSRMNRYHNADVETGGNGRRCRSPVNMAPRPAARSYSEDYLPDHHHHAVEASSSGKRYHSRDMSRSQHSVPFANDEAIPLQRYRSPTRQVENPRLSRTAVSGSNAYPYEEESQRRVKRSDSKYYAKPNEHDKRRSMMEAIEDQKRRNSNEIAKEFKRRSYQDHRTGSEISYQGSISFHSIFLVIN